MEGDTAGSHEDHVLGEATRWCTVVGVLWYVRSATSRPLLKWGSFVSHCRQWTTMENPSPTFLSGIGVSLPLIFRLNILDLGDGHSSTRLHINDLLPFFIPLVEFWLRVGTCVWFRSLQLGHHWLLGPTLTSVVSGALMELTPLSCVLLCLRGVVIFLQLRRVIMGRLVLALSFALRFGGAFPLLQVHRSKVSLLLFKFMLDLDNVSIGNSKSRCPRTPSHPRCTCVDNHHTWVPKVS